MFEKRDATEVEARAALEAHAKHWNIYNPKHKIELAEWEAKELKAVAEGYKAEICSCGLAFCAFHHWTTCRAKACPFSTGKSMLDYMKESTMKESAE